MKIIRWIDAFINFFCRTFKIRFAVKYRKLSAEEVKALGLDRLEKKAVVEKTVVEKPYEM